MSSHDIYRRTRPDADPWSLLDCSTDRSYSASFRRLWPLAVEWVRPYYDSFHLFQTVVWMLRLDPDATEPLLVAALTHDMERHFPGGTQPDKAAGAWDDVEYNRRHARRSADIVCAWLREQEMPAHLVDAVQGPILEHEFGGSPDGDVIQAADSLSFLDVNTDLVAAWVANGETSLESAVKKLDWMYERIRLPRGTELARALHERSVRTVRATVTADAGRAA